MTPSSLYLIRHVFGIADYPLPDESFTAEHNGECISHVGIFWRRLTLTGHGLLDVGGIGLVCTHPQWRRHGLASGLLEAARRRCALHGRPHVALFAGEAESAWYHAHGFTSTNVEHLLTLPPVGHIASTDPAW